MCFTGLLVAKSLRFFENPTVKTSEDFACCKSVLITLAFYTSQYTRRSRQRDELFLCPFYSKCGLQLGHSKFCLRRELFALYAPAQGSTSRRTLFESHTSSVLKFVFGWICSL